jgi:serine/threonine-protein kinase
MKPSSEKPFENFTKEMALPYARSEEASGTSQNNPSDNPGAALVASFVAGTLLANQYEIVRRLGMGGMGAVYKCMDKMTGRLVAVKVLKPEHAANTKIMQRFQREAQAIANLEHPNLVKLYSFHLNDSLPLIVMEYVDGKPLDQILEQNGAMSIERSLKLAMQICDALSYVHMSGVIHRDLKPSNIIIKKSLTGEDIAKVVDFGIAKIKDVQTTTTSTGEIFGSPSYMSPEQAVGKEAGEAADQYALGCVLFECLTGLKPFISENVLAVMLQHIRDVPPTLKVGSLGKDFPPELEAIVKRMLEKDPEDRFSSIAAVRDALSGKKIEPAIHRLTNSNSRIVVGNPFLFGTLVSATTLLVVALVGIGWNYFQKSHPLSTQEAHLEQQAIKAEQSLSQSPSHDEFGVDGFDSPEALITYIKKEGHVNDFKILDVYRNSLSSEAIKILSNTPQINVLSLSYFKKMNLLKDLKTSSIQELNLSDTDIDDSSVRYLAKENLPNLQRLRLNGCLRLSSKGFGELRRLEKLTYLDVGEALLTDDGVKELSSIPNLASLFLNNNKLTSNSYKYIAEMKNLEELEISGTNPDGKFALLRKLKKLKKLNLLNLVLQDNDIKDLEQLKNLTCLRMHETNITDNEVLELVNALPRLTIIDCHGCNRISPEVHEKLRNIMWNRRSLEPVR